MMKHIIVLFLFAVLAATVLTEDSTALATYNHATAAAIVGRYGIGIRSSGNCNNRNIKTCTSLDGIQTHVISGSASIVVLKQASGCAITITGGTEVGHARGIYSHENGYKLDVAMSSCLTNYIKSKFTSIGGGKWRAASGNIYYYEGNHWDITFMSW